MSSPPPPSQPSGSERPAPSENWRTQREELASSSQYPAVSSAAMIDLLPKRSTTKAYDLKAPSIVNQKPPPPLALEKGPSIDDKSPRNPLRLNRKVRMLNIFRLCGPTGLASFLYRECQVLNDGEHPHASWQTMINDRKSGNEYVTRLLSTLSPEVTESLIKGTLVQDIQTVPEVKEFWGAHMRMGDYPGIYFNTIVTNKITVSTRGQQPITNAGRYLSTNDIKSLLDKYTAYIDGSD
ncbi:MAG: hypothetical protein Q9226_007008 [Calogaya cf. arnoldii]